jgi:aspartate aminotransferase
VVQELVVLFQKNKELMATAMKFAQARLSPTFAQVASEAALTPQSYFDNVISEYRERRDTLITELNKIEGVKVATQRGLYCIAELPIENADDFARWLLESYDLDEKQ